MKAADLFTWNAARNRVIPLNLLRRWHAGGPPGPWDVPWYPPPDDFWDQPPPPALAPLLRELAELHRALAWTPGAPPDELDRHLLSPHASVRTALADNPESPPDALDFLADDEDPTVRLAVARHPATPQHSLALLAGVPAGERGADEDILLALLARPDCPEAALWRAAAAPPEVQGVAALHPNLQPALRPSLLAAGQKAERFVLDADLLLVSDALDEHERVYLAWVTHDWTVLDHLARDASLLVRRATAANLSTPGPALAVLATDADPSTRGYVASHPGASPATRAMAEAPDDAA